MPKIYCVKCGAKVELAPYGKGRGAVAAAGSDHASKNGCDYIAANVDKISRDLSKK